MYLIVWRGIGHLHIIANTCDTDLTLYKQKFENKMISSQLSPTNICNTRALIELKMHKGNHEVIIVAKDN